MADESTEVGVVVIDEGVVTTARDLKEAVVTDSDPDRKGSDDLAPIVWFFDDDGLVAHTICDQVDRDAALTLVRILTPRLAATTVTLAFDTHMSHSGDDPVTGEPWAAGAMQRACDDTDACASGLITDAITITCFGARGDWQVILPYHLHTTTHTVAWQGRDDHIHGSGHATLGGLIPDVVRAALVASSAPAALGAILAEELGVGDAAAGLLRRWVAARSVASGPWTTTIVARGDAETRILADLDGH